MRLHAIKTPILNLAYEEAGPKRGEPLILVHGWPDSPRTWDKLLPLLHQTGYRTITPYLRGYAPTSFRNPLLGRKPRRSGQPVALAQDIIDLADKLGLRRFHFVGHDWGARAAYALSALFPQRLKAMVALSVPFHPGMAKPPRLSQAQAFWYQWFLCTAPGEAKFRKDPTGFAREQWNTWSPPDWYSEDEFEAASNSWGSEDFVEITLHAYRSRWGHAEFDPRYADFQARFLGTRTLSTPTLLIHGMEDRCVLPESTDGASHHFTGPYHRILLDGVGHFPQRENPGSTAGAILEHLRRYA